MHLVLDRGTHYGADLTTPPFARWTFGFGSGSFILARRFCGVDFYGAISGNCLFGAGGGVYLACLGGCAGSSNGMEGNWK